MRAGLGNTRSTSAASQATVKAVETMLAHPSAAMALEVYSGLFGDHLDGVAERLDAGTGVYR